MNDGKVDREGRFVAGYMDYEESATRSAHCFGSTQPAPSRSSTTALSVPTDLVRSPDGRTFYFADTYTREIWTYDYDTETGVTADRHVFCSFPAAGLKGLPDGATVDAEGFVWSVSVYEGELVRFAARRQARPGRRTFRRKHNQPKFRGPGLDVAYVTSMARAVKGVKPKEREAGALFAVHGLGVRGLPEPRFAG